MKRLIATILLCSTSHSALAMSDIQHWETTNGARVYFVETHQIPMVQFAVGFDAAAARDPEDKYGLGSLTNTLMDDGAGGVDEEAVAESFASVGAEFSAQSARDMAVLGLRVLSDVGLMDPAVETFSAIIGEPDFPVTALERERKRALVRIKQARQSPRSVAKRLFYLNLFGSHPYGHMPVGNARSLKTITRSDLIAFHNRYYTATNAVIAIVGDLNRGQAGDIAERIVASLPAGTPLRPLPTVEVREGGVDVNEDFPSSQSHLLLGQPGIVRDDPDYFPLYVGNHILGGSGLISLLSEQIREERGLAYSVYSYFVPMRRRGPYIVGLQTKNDQAEEAEKITLETVRKFIGQGPTDKQLQSAKNNITGGFPLRIDSNKKIANNILGIGFYGLPIDYLDTFSEQVSAVTLDEVHEAFRRRVDPRQWVRIEVGPVDN
ncbi:MAG: putative zinc protease [Gammaproteobacteria bacterium]|nr:putative zinc protease [Gammaproteobacteria bacterium]